jgi:hypothetical protein
MNTLHSQLAPHTARFVVAALVAAIYEHRCSIVFMGRRDKPGDDGLWWSAADMDRRTDA